MDVCKSRVSRYSKTICCTEQLQLLQETGRTRVDKGSKLRVNVRSVKKLLTLIVKLKKTVIHKASHQPRTQLVRSDVNRIVVKTSDVVREGCLELFWETQFGYDPLLHLSFRTLEKGASRLAACPSCVFCHVGLCYTWTITMLIAFIAIMLG